MCSVGSHDLCFTLQNFQLENIRPLMLAGSHGALWDFLWSKGFSGLEGFCDWDSS